MYFLGIFQNIGDAIGQSLRSLMGGIIVKIYELIEYMYLLFKDELIISTYIGSNNTCIYSILNSLISYYPYDLALSFSSTKS